MLPSHCCNPFAVEELVLRGLWGETWERSNLPRKSQESKAEYLANSIPAAGSWDSTGAGAGSCGRECWQGSAPCGSVEKHCSLLTVTHRHTHVNTHLHANFLQAADIYIWRLVNGGAALCVSKRKNIEIMKAFSTWLCPAAVKLWYYIIIIIMK